MDRYDGARSKKIVLLRQLIEESEKIVFLGGAGVSTESGVPDFRSGQGIFNQDSGLEYRPVDIISHSFFVKHPEEFFDFYRRKLCYPNAKPNKAHKALLRLERSGKLFAVITQNVDNLHQLAGSKKTIELHGSVRNNYCLSCGKTFSLQFMLNSTGIPKCDECGGMVRPGIVLYEEHLDHNNIDRAVAAIEKADLMIIGGTSLTVYPAATFAQFLPHDRVVIINKSSTYLDLQAMLTIHDSIGDVLDEAIPKRMRKRNSKSTNSPNELIQAEKTKSSAKKTAPSKNNAKTKGSRTSRPQSVAQGKGTSKGKVRKPDDRSGAKGVEDKT
ncbi:MAG: NAD-dependent protein deacylase [Clostridiales bacterium]|nr:NAD-dependent protein deacylase [Clostridiales bacterium]